MNGLGRWLSGGKRLSVAAVAPFLSGRYWWVAVLALALLGCLLILAVCWMAKYTDAAEVQTPLFAWKRRASTARQKVSKGDKSPP